MSEEKEKLSKGEFEACLELAKSIQPSIAINMQLVELVKKVWYRREDQWIDRLWVSQQDLQCLLNVAFEERPFTLNYVKKKHRDTTTNGLKEKVLPDLVKVGMITKDETGRYVTYLVTQSGREWILYNILQCARCHMTGICERCKEDCPDDKCYWCDGKKTCDRCDELFRELGGHHKLVELINNCIVA
jgi:hypothetical protein